MTVCLMKTSGRVILMARADGDGAMGDLVFEVAPGESALGKTYEEWRALPEGLQEVDHT